MESISKGESYSSWKEKEDGKWKIGGHRRQPEERRERRLTASCLLCPTDHTYAGDGAGSLKLNRERAAFNFS